MRRSMAPAILAILVVMAVFPAFADTSYAGLQQRPDKALSAQQIDDLRAGRGMGMALAAELNDYPGPRHVLDLSDKLGLGLTPAQRKRVSRLFDEMAGRARALGGQILAAERRLDRLFAQKRAGDAELRSITAVIARRNGDLRYVHLGYHLSVCGLLSDRQIARYAALRGSEDQSDKKSPEPGRHRGHGRHK
jgi:hypothetical protein